VVSVHSEVLPISTRSFVVVGDHSNGSDAPDDAPRPDWADDAPAANSARHERVSVAPYLVLVVDDHVDTRGAYAQHLQTEGFRTAEADNGVIAIKMARELLPDAILLDYAMPMMDGVQASLVLKHDETTRGIPIIMLTAFHDLVRGRGLCDRYLDKPCDPQKVVATLRSVLESIGLR
jgi:CheY-like chemotaxis protein